MLGKTNHKGGEINNVYRGQRGSGGGGSMEHPPGEGMETTGERG